VDPHRRTPAGRRVLGDESECLLPGCESLIAPSTALYPLNVLETELLNGRLGLNPDGEPCGALPLEHSFCKEQRVLGCYPLPGWEHVTIGPG
jgi:hypothetical protein